MTNQSLSASAEQLAMVRGLNALLSARRAIVLASLGISVLVGVAVLLMPRQYTATVVLQPQSRRSGGNIAGLASQLGVNLPLGDNAQPPAFYSDLVRSPTLLDSLVSREFPSRSGTTTIEAVYEIEGDDLALRRERSVGRLQADIHPTVNTRTGTLRIDVTLKDPQFSKAVLEAIVEELTKYNQRTRQSQARAERQFAESRATEAHRELREAEDRMRGFLDANRGPWDSPNLKFVEDGLRREITARQQVYTTVMQIFEQARLEEVRDTPVLSLVEPPRVPVIPDRRRLALKVLIAYIMSIVIGAVATLARRAIVPESSPDPLGRFDALRASALADLRRPWRLLSRSDS